MRGAAIVALMSSIAGCSLDLARLRAGLDASMADVPGLDAPAADVPGLDGATDAPGDGGGGGVPLVTDTETFAARPTWIAVASHSMGARVVVIVPELGALHGFLVTGSGCGIQLTSEHEDTAGWSGAPVLVDLNEDTAPDIVAQRGTAVAVLLEGVGGSFEAGGVVALDVDVFAALGAGRLDGDELADVFAVERGARLFPMFADGTGDLSLGTTITDVSRTYLDGVVADLDGTNGDDLATLAGTTDGIVFEARLNSGTGSFGASRVGRIGRSADVALAVGDPNASLRRPMYALVDDDLYIGELSGTSIVVSSPLAVGTDLEDLVAADVDGDGETELVASSSGGALLHVFRADGVDGLTRRSTIPVSSGAQPTELAALDVDGDLRDELFVLTTDAVVVISPGCTEPP